MDRYTYNCEYCGKAYTPKRRFKQKYCSSSCRVNSFTKRKKAKENLPDFKKPKEVSVKDKMSWSGIGNAAVGSLATNIATNLLTKEENKPATKGDIQKILNIGISKLTLIKNMPPRTDGARAYFDITNQIIIYKKNIHVK
ncbi:MULTISPECIES: hypothetical protein [Cellulophaga]|jgi:hypothetical protein|uniref:Uncharacterized protein n=1 Tax=Cellulophaga baltica TaxID=76594 RepID=A0A1G7LC53_9FLAO|nr:MULTISPECIES: hypothetical protein [Cellulophaga]KGK29974.1 hypothetical protein EL45_12270 [Cellulophaga sp. E6(2014)]MCR1026653.1 hypothetical protein [Cellulophaga baltica]SDF47068.1 hypothetical protein SAMN04487992_1178 [Cellulophaga baltica]